MAYKRKYKPRRRFKPRARHRRRPAYGRFGRISAPELKNRTLSGRGFINSNSVLDAVVFPSVTQGISENERIGNRINGRFLNIKLCMYQMLESDAGVARPPTTCRWVLWQNKDPTSNAAGSLSGLTLTSFINTKVTRIIKHGYITLGASGVTKVKSINNNLRNLVINFKEDSDVSANTTQRYYLSIYSNEGAHYEFQSKFYFSDN